MNITTKLGVIGVINLGMRDFEPVGTTKIPRGGSGGSGCKGICTRYKATKPVGAGRYASGQKRCQICEVFMKTDEMWCPCCGYRLRSKPRNKKYKIRLRQTKEDESKKGSGTNRKKSKAGSKGRKAPRKRV